MTDSSRQRGKLARFIVPGLEDHSSRSLMLFVAWLALLAIGAVAWGIFGASAQYAATTWPTAQAEVTRSALNQGTLDFAYRFVVDGREIESQSRRLSRLSAYYALEDQARFAGTHPPGSTITVWYDPDDPSRTTLSPGVSWLDLVIPAAAVVGLAFGAIPAIRELRRRGPIG